MRSHARPTPRLRPRAAAVLAVAAALAAGCAAEPHPDLPEQGAEILWDDYGVPHVYAATAGDLFRGFGWAQMASHGDLVLRLVARARGRAERSWTPGAVVGAPEPAADDGRSGAAGSTAAAGSVRDVRPPGASNAWAVGPSLSASGRAMLLANPHLPWHGLFTWYEAHLVAPGVDAYGAPGRAAGRTA